jgi:hypothetical protein
MSTSLTTHSPADVLLKYLEQEGLTTYNDVVWPVMVNIILPTAPDRLIMGSDTQGFTPTKHFDGSSHDRPGVQLVLRSTPNDLSSLRGILHNIEEHLLPLHRVLVIYDAASYRLHNVQRVSGPIPLPRDQSLRWLWSVNYILTITQEG